MITHISISPLKLTKAVTKKIFEMTEFKDNLIQVKQAVNEHVVIQCEVDIGETKFDYLREKLSAFTGAKDVNFTFTEQPCVKID
jgi:hypothetical protein